MRIGSVTRSRLAALAGGVLGIGLLGWSVRGIHFDALRSTLAGVSWPFLLLVAALYLAVFWCKAWRLACILRPIRTISPGELLAPVFAGNLGNLVLPAYAGEVTRAVVLGRYLQVPVASVLSATVIERVLDFIVLLSLVAWLLLDARVVDAEIATMARAIGAITLTLVVVMVLALTLRARLEAFAESLAARTRLVWLARLARALTPALHVLQSVARPQLVAELVVSSIAHWALLGLCTHFAIIATGIDVGWGAAVSALTLVTAAMTLPSAPGWLGAVQIGFVLGLRPYGVTESAAFATSIVFHACVYFMALFAGLACLKSVGLRWREVAAFRATAPNQSRAA
jgi:glycosyltransferase 2 family protein